MKLWALVVAALYGIFLLVVVVPAFHMVFDRGGPLSSAYSDPAAWWLPAIMVVSQLLLLTLPVRIAGGRPMTRATMWPTVLMAGLLSGVLVVGAIGAMLEFLLGEGVFEEGVFFRGSAEAFALAIVSWALWAVVFHRMSRRVDARDLVTRQCRALFAGSVLELLVALPTHLVVRNRTYCCAGVYTGLGIATGTAVMLLSFGPALFFLFAERWRRLQPDRET